MEAPDGGFEIAIAFHGVHFTTSNFLGEGFEIGAEGVLLLDGIAQLGDGRSDSRKFIFGSSVAAVGREFLELLELRLGFGEIGESGIAHPPIVIIWHDETALALIIHIPKGFVLSLLGLFDELFHFSDRILPLFLGEFLAGAQKFTPFSAETFDQGGELGIVHNEFPGGLFSSLDRARVFHGHLAHVPEKFPGAVHGSGVAHGGEEFDPCGFEGLDAGFEGFQDELVFVSGDAIVVHGLSGESLTLAVLVEDEGEA